MLVLRECRGNVGDQAEDVKRVPAAAPGRQGRCKRAGTVSAC